MPRPRVYNSSRVTTAIRLCPELHAQLRNLAEERRVSVNYLVEKALEEYVERLIPIDELRLTRDGNAS